ncbi:MAG: MCE family protein [Myxococcales bacterium]|jgi:phospholipid/cholesterol/gamma-HCH transport system substrate-binding protein|nr:MCE family protein [Myxococcales bacterium]
MARVTTAAKVGIFTVVTAGAGLLIYRFVHQGGGPGDGYVVYALMDDAMGVARHSRVRVAGIPVGSIESVRLEGDRARVDIRIDDDVALYEDAAVAKVSSSLLGEYFLRISPGTEGRERLQDGDRIHVVEEGTSTDDIMKEVAAIARDVRAVSQSLAATVGSDEGRENLKDTLENLARVTEALNQTVRENRESVRNILANVERLTERGGPEVERILENVRVSTNEVRTLLAQGAAPGEESGEVRQIVERVNRASESLENALEDIESISARLERGEGTLGRLTKDERLINEVEGITESVGEFVGGLSRIQTIVNLRTDYQFLTSTVKSFVEVRVQPQEDKYYHVELVNDPRGYTLIEQIDVTSTNPNDPNQYREVRTTTTNRFRFSLQFAQRVGPFWGRFGIKESTGGVGLDTLLFDDRFELRQDLFGFGEVVLPRWRVSLGYEFVRRLWLLGGVDDILSGDRRDYFIGLQLRFNDRDLKTIIPFASVP